MNKFSEWYWNNRNEITWFVIGMCTIIGIASLANGDYGSAVINLGVAYLNYMVNQR
jgi:hypothetical protein